MENTTYTNPTICPNVKEVPGGISADAMTVSELHEVLMVGYREMQNSKVQVAKTAFARFRDQHK